MSPVVGRKMMQGKGIGLDVYNLREGKFFEETLSTSKLRLRSKKHSKSYPLK